MVKKLKKILHMIRNNDSGSGRIIASPREIFDRHFWGVLAYLVILAVMGCIKNIYPQ